MAISFILKAVFPIGIGDFSTGNALVILASEATWICLPTALIFLIVQELNICGFADSRGTVTDQLNHLGHKSNEIPTVT